MEKVAKGFSMKLSKTFPKVYIILLNYNGWADTIECLESLLRIDYPNYQIIVVDNNSPNNSLEYIKLWAEGKLDVWVNPKHPLRKLSFPPTKKPIKYSIYEQNSVEKNEINKDENSIIFIKAKENRGFAAGNNLGIKYAFFCGDFDYVCLLNNDTVVERDFLSKVIEEMEKDKNIGICSGRINYYEEPKKIWFEGGHFNPWIAKNFHHNQNMYEEEIGNFKGVRKDLSFLTACFWVIRKEILKDSLLNEEYFMYMEDVEYSLNVLKKGYKLCVNPKSKIYHKVGGSSGGDLSDVSAFWGMKNRVKFIKKNLNPLQKITSISFILLGALPKYINWLKKGKKSAIKSQIKGFLSGIKES